MRRVLDGIEPGGIHLDQLRGRVEHRPGGGGEVLQASAHGQNDVGIGSEVVGAGGADDPERAAVQRVSVRDERATGRRLHHGNAMVLSESAQLRGRPRVARSSTGDEQRPTGGPQQGDRVGDGAGVRPWPRNPV